MAHVTSQEPDVVVIGAGFAGLSAAVRLARAGARVLVLEARARLGGRATAFPDRETGEIVDNGQHVLLGCYTDTFAFLREIGAEAFVQVQSSLAVTMVDRSGRRTRLSCPTSLPSPLHLLAGLFDWEALAWRDKWSALAMATPLKLARREVAGDGTVKAASAGETVENWLIRNGQTARIREMLWDPLALAALNQSPQVAAAPPFARVLGEMFGKDPRAAAIALPARPLDQMYAEPARRYLDAHGSAVRTGAAARVRVENDRIVSVRAGDQEWHPAIVIVAAPWYALPEVFDPAPPALMPIIDAARRTAASPIVTVNLWFDRAVMDEPFVGLPGRTMQWVFDKRQVFGQEASHLSLVSSGAASVVALANDVLIEQAYQEVVQALPRVDAARLVRATVIREPRATFSLAPGQPPRPQTATPVPRLFLAGDWIDTGLPATIEGAVRSGHRAAELCIRNE